jgi:hypothetical protein
MSEVFGSATEHPLNEFSDTEERPIEIGDPGCVARCELDRDGSAERRPHRA